MLGLYWRIGRLLEKLGMSEGRAFTIQNKIYKFEDWLFRHPITILMITLPDSIADNKWHNCEAAFDNVKFANKSGIWRKTIIFSVKAKVNDDN